ncbi:hypothetical protein N7456_010542 [Penicillium angulare]|uniref:Uncharacterized protein n=1 Tax=Penicillium angulare TaxID=116970 RepID=A0A9W9K6U4_9EURO|nr:hypothetical protein N7456_010542 [Penicillium angulare]
MRMGPEHAYELCTTLVAVVLVENEAEVACHRSEKPSLPFTGLLQQKWRLRDIQPAVDSKITDEAERTIRESGQDIVSENKDPTGNYYPFRILQANGYVERVVIEWFKVGN